jgi:putative DNA methylase
LHPIHSPKKLIEVALPLDDINIASAREKSIRHGHPSTLHLWWARRPLAAARAVLFAQMVNDPGYETGQGFTRGVNKKEAARERERLFTIIRELVKWENTNNETVLEAARAEIRKSWRETCELNKKHPQAAELFNPDKLPAFHDPFAGGGAIPLEAQRLGLESHASDLNPVAVLINKAMIEIPPKFAGRAPVGPLPVAAEPTARNTREMHEDWSGAKGLAEDVRRYGHWMRDQAQQRIGHLYPTVEITAAMAKERPDLKPLVGQQLTVIAWLWARTVRSPNPAYSQVEVPLASTFLLSTKAGKEAWVEPVVSGHTYRFEVRTAAAGQGKPPASANGGTTAGKRAAFVCLMSDSPVTYDHIRAEGKSGRMGQRLMAVVAEGARGRVYLAPDDEMQAQAESAKPSWAPDVQLPDNPRDFKTPNYGLTTFGDLFTPRQLVALTTFSDLVGEARERIRADALQAGMPDDGRGLDAGGNGATAYAEAVAVLLGIAVSRTTNTINALAVWSNSRDQSVNLFSRQAIPMAWDFPEVNPFAGAAGDFTSTTASLAKSLPTDPVQFAGQVHQMDAQRQRISETKLVSTDPPYYDNIGYADLSDFFYVWLRRSLRTVYPNLFATVAVPKADELVATPYRHGSKERAEKFFLDGMTAAMHNVAELAHSAFPVTIYYAFKQSETKDGGTSSTGWETFLDAVICAGFALSGTWPMRTERPTGVKVNMNALASSIILVCRRRPDDAPSISRKDFLRELKETLKEALEAMLGGEGGASPIAPVDLAQAAIGPGMAVYSQYAAVLEANGEPMSVHSALTLINKQVDDTLGGENFDADTNFCLGWFQDVGWSAGEFGTANTLAQAKATSVAAVEQAGVITAKGGKVKLLKPADYDANWDPREDNRTPVWEALHQLIRALTQGGESAAGTLLARMPERSGDIRRLAFWLYTLCERKGWAEDARGYNELVTAWHGIESASHETGVVNVQTTLDI